MTPKAPTPTAAIAPRAAMRAMRLCGTALMLGLLAVAAGSAMMPVGPALAQAATGGTKIGFGGLRQDPSAPVEVAAEMLTVDQETGIAVFSGDVVVTQGQLTLTAPRIEVRGDSARDDQGIREVLASGGVFLRTAQDTARSETAVYDVATGILRMQGDVVLTQGTSTISGQQLVADLTAGTGVVEGRVRTVFIPGASGPGGN
jgi:lipopolysaccharide export system protein LptA